VLADRTGPALGRWVAAPGRSHAPARRVARAKPT
jgi:hypothetical protein